MTLGFHITRRCNLDEISEKGLLPYWSGVFLACTPAQSYVMASQNKKAFLTFLGADIELYAPTENDRVMLAVDIEGIEVERTMLTEFGEYVCNKTIPPERIFYLADVDTQRGELVRGDERYTLDLERIV